MKKKVISIIVSLLLVFPALIQSYAEEGRTLKDICENEKTLEAVEAMKDSDEIEVYVRLNYPEAEAFRNSLSSVPKEEYDSKFDELSRMCVDFCEKFAEDYSIKQPTNLRCDAMFICKLTLDGINSIMNDERLEGIAVVEQGIEADITTDTNEEASTDSDKPDDKEYRDMTDSDSDIEYNDPPTTAEGWRDLLRNFCKYVISKYEEGSDGSQDGVESLFEGYTEEAIKTAREYLKDESTIESMTKEKAKSSFYGLKAMILTVKRELYDELLTLAEKEKRPCGYFEDIEWQRFSEALENARTYEAEKSWGEYESLREWFGRVIMANRHIFYDVDQNGELDLSDVTTMQRYMAELEDLSTSQRYIVSRNTFNDENMETIADMQKIIAGLKSLDAYERTGNLAPAYHYDYAEFVLPRYSHKIEFEVARYEYGIA